MSSRSSRTTASSNRLVPPVARVAHGLGHAIAVVDDSHPIAHLDIAVVALGDGDALAVILLHRGLDAAAGRILVDGRAGNAARYGAQKAADDRAAHRVGGGAADRSTADGAQATADQRAVAHAGIATPDRHLADSDHAAGLAAIAAGRRGVDHARLHGAAAGVTGADESAREGERNQEAKQPLAE